MNGIVYQEPIETSLGDPLVKVPIESGHPVLNAVDKFPRDNSESRVGAKKVSLDAID